MMSSPCVKRLAGELGSLKKISEGVPEEKRKNTICCWDVPNVPEVEFHLGDLGNFTISSQNYNDYKVGFKTLSQGECTQ